MEGDRSSLTSRPARVLEGALDFQGWDRDRIAGALVVFCGGCMMAIEDELGDVSAQVGEVLGGRPYLGIFTFGEQGRFLAGGNRHGNLMIVTVVFSR